MKSKDELKSFFENGDIPKQEDFWEWQDSYWHKDEKLPANAVDLSAKADLVGGKVPASQLPSYVDDVIEFDSFENLPSTGEKGKIYIVTDTNNQYRWSGSEYIQINSGDTSEFSNLKVSGNGIVKHNLLSGDAFSFRNTSAWASSTNKPGGLNGAVVNFTPYNLSGSTYGYSLGARNNKLYFATEENSVFGIWNEVYHSGNINLTNYLSSSGTSMKTITTSNFNDVVNGEGNVWLGDIYQVSPTVTGLNSNYGTIFNINGKASHDKTQFIFEGQSGSIYYRKSWYSNGVWSSLRKIWDSNNFNPNNYITTNTAQTGLTGDKSTSGDWTFNGNTANHLTLLRNGSTINNSIAMGFGMTPNMYFGMADSNTFSFGNNINMTLSTRKFWIDYNLNTANLPGQTGGTFLQSRDNGGLSISTTTDSSKAEMILRHNWTAKNQTFGIGGVSSPTSGSMGQWGMVKWKNDRIINGIDGFFGWFGDSDTLMASALAGIGTRMVVAAPNGTLSTHTIPTSSAYTSSNGILLTDTNFTPVYGTTANTIAQGNDPRINNGQTAFEWGNHAAAGYASTTFVQESINDITLEITDPDYLINVKNKFVTIIITDNFALEKINWEQFYPEQSVTVINTGSGIITLELQGKAFDKIDTRETSEYYINKNLQLIKKGNYKETAILA